MTHPQRAVRSSIPSQIGAQTTKGRRLGASIDYGEELWNWLERKCLRKLERETGFEPATLALAILKGVFS